MRPIGLALAEPHGDKEALLQRLAQAVSVFRIQFWTAVLLFIGSSAGASSAAATTMRCRINQQAWSLPDGRCTSWRALGVDLEPAAR